VHLKLHCHGHCHYATLDTWLFHRTDTVSFFAVNPKQWLLSGPSLLLGLFFLAAFASQAAPDAASQGAHAFACADC
jgi:hypothetical protein